MHSFRIIQPNQHTVTMCTFRYIEYSIQIENHAGFYKNWGNWKYIIRKLQQTDSATLLGYIDYIELE